MRSTVVAAIGASMSFLKADAEFDMYIHIQKHCAEQRANGCCSKRRWVPLGSSIWGTSIVSARTGSRSQWNARRECVDVCDDVVGRVLLRHLARQAATGEIACIRRTGVYTQVLIEECAQNTMK